MTTTVAYAKFVGKITVKANGLNKSTIEAAGAEALAVSFGVTADKVKVTATESRRLNAMDASERRLKGTWTLTFELHASPAKVAAVEKTVKQMVTAPATFTQAFTQSFKTKLVAAGVPTSVVSSMVVTGVVAEQVAVPGGSFSTRTTTAKIATGDLSSGAFQATASMVVIAALKMISGM